VASHDLGIDWDYERSRCWAPQASVPTNPKDKVGATKPPLDLIPGVAEVQLSLAMKYGASRYGVANWRQHEIGARCYIGAAKRHLASWLDGEDLDADSKVSHLAHVMACMAIMLDAESIGKLVDDRPTPGGAASAIRKFTEKAE
jgi:hypothetical protein